eukprot:12812731-Prorocentrum_lima.AAC.1
MHRAPSAQCPWLPPWLHCIAEPGHRATAYLAPTCAVLEWTPNHSAAPRQICRRNHAANNRPPVVGQ